VSGVALLGTNGGELMTIKGSSLNKSGGLETGDMPLTEGGTSRSSLPPVRGKASAPMKPVCLLAG